MGGAAGCAQGSDAAGECGVAMAKLPTKFNGAKVVRGLGMNYEKYEKLVDKKALGEWEAREPVYVVVEDKLELDSGADVQVFLDEEDALRIARARSNGNVNHRVLKVTEQTLVVGTESDW